MNLLPTLKKNSLQTLHNYGQSVWLNYIQRSLITSGELQRMVASGEVWGVTSNPAIFQKAIASSTDYDETLKNLQQNQDFDAMSLYKKLAIEDIQATADILRPVYEQTLRRDGYVSLESPYLAHETEATIFEAQRLWQAVGRENLMIKVPATPAGIPAIAQLISNGINVNVTLLFSQEAYEQVAYAYVKGLEAFAAKGGDVSRVANVASFFISRIDTTIDNLITNRLKTTTDKDEQGLLQIMQGKSTGKDGLGLIPVDREPIGAPEIYGSDRLFVYIRLTSAPNYAQDAAVAALERAGQPVVRIRVADPDWLGQEFFRWEIATAVAGAIIGINAFNQPNVEASKIVTRQLTAEYEKTGNLPPETPILYVGAIKDFLAVDLANL